MSFAVDGTDDGFDGRKRAGNDFATSQRKIKTRWTFESVSEQKNIQNEKSERKSQQRRIKGKDRPRKTISTAIPFVITLARM